jgi:hypothetical protein
VLMTCSVNTGYDLLFLECNDGITHVIRVEFVPDDLSHVVRSQGDTVNADSVRSLGHHLLDVND